MMGLFMVYGAALYVFGWGWTVQELWDPSILFPGGELLILTPFLAALVSSWAFFYDAERALHDPGPTLDGASTYWSRWAYVGFHVRHNLALVFIPVGLLIFIKASFRLLAWMNVGSGLCVLLAIVGVLCLFVTIPWVLRLALGLNPMPPGPLRDRLLAAAHRLRFRCSRVMIWNTRGGVANAMVAGILPYPRYVILTDRLASDLTPDEVEAVFGHEVGHVKHHHMLYYLSFLALSLATMYTGAALLLPQEWVAFLPLGNLNSSNLLQILPNIAAIAAYIFIVFGFLSRRCERQADIYGCRTVSCLRADCSGHETEMLPDKASGLCPTGIRTFIQALERVALVNGMSRDRPGWLQSWQHSTIARRVDFLQKMLVDPATERGFQRRVFLVKCGAFVGLSMLLVVLGTLLMKG